MPPKKMQPKVSSSRTGKFFPCPMSGILHQKIAVGITRGPKGWASLRCGECRAQLIMGEAWKDEMGLTREAAIGLGMDVRNG